MKKYSNLEMEVISLNNADVLTTSGGAIDESKDPNKYCINSTHNPIQFWDCVRVCYHPFVDKEVCDWYKGGMNGKYPR